MLLQVATQVNARQVAPPNLLTSASCRASVCGNDNWEPFMGDALFEVVVQKYDWKTAYCKLSALPEQAPTATPTMMGACLIKGCLQDGNLIKGANEHALLNPWTPAEAEYCFREHCNNAQFDLRTVTQAQGMSYCDQRFGPAWRSVTAGPDGKGWDNEKPGSGLWECSRGTYHCDWGYCKLHYCNKPELLSSYKQNEAMKVQKDKEDDNKEASEEKQQESMSVMEEYAAVSAQMAQDGDPEELLSAEASPAQLLAAQMGLGQQQQAALAAQMNLGARQQPTSLMQNQMQATGISNGQNNGQMNAAQMQAAQMQMAQMQAAQMQNALSSQTGLAQRQQKMTSLAQTQMTPSMASQVPLKGMNGLTMEDLEWADFD